MFDLDNIGNLLTSPSDIKNEYEMKLYCEIVSMKSYRATSIVNEIRS